jgi:hypothetical protein
MQLLSGLADEVRGRFWTEVNYSVVDEGLNIYVMGDHGDCVYFVVDGSVELIHHRSLDPYDRVTPVDERSGATVVSEGGYFGLTSMFPVSIPTLDLTSCTLKSCTLLGSCFGYEYHLGLRV